MYEIPTRFAGEGLSLPTQYFPFHFKKARLLRDGHSLVQCSFG